MSLSLYFHTIRHLRPIQIIERARFRLFKPAPDRSAAPPLRPGSDSSWTAPPRRPPTQLGPARFRFLNVERELRGAADWNNDEWEKLWLYNLHYFDDLNAELAGDRTAWHEALIERWIRENPPPAGNGWEPYTLSLRIVNWIKWSFEGHALSPDTVASLAVQARYLARRLEYHLLGNHLLTNAKALVFAGLYFDGAEANEWLASGLDILAAELDEQILADGGHFERSPMYHHIVLEDVLDVLNAMNRYRSSLAASVPDRSLRWRETAAAMLGCAAAMSHPDGDIALVNDAALGIAPALDELRQYAGRLGIAGNDAGGKIVHLRDTGYLAVGVGPAWALLDVGRIGPDYVPGHAHADTLSFELSLAGRRVIVDSGTSTYAPTAERQRQRSTAAHNTVEIDGASSSEVWGSFRVARRARPTGLEIAEEADGVRVRCAHDGYARLPGRPVHARQWRIGRDGLVVEDTIEGRYDSAVARFRFHPDWETIRADGQSGEMRAAEGGTISWTMDGGRGRVVESSYHPQFGLRVPCQCLEIEFSGTRVRTCFAWAATR